MNGLQGQRLSLKQSQTRELTSKGGLAFPPLLDTKDTRAPALPVLPLFPDPWI